MTDPNATGTTGGDPQGGGNPTGTAASTAAGGPATDEDIAAVRAERDRLKAAHEQSLLEKQHLEDERRRRQELEEELERTRRAGLTPPTADPLAVQFQNDLQLAAEGDAQAMLRVMAATTQASQKEITDLRKENAWYREMEQVPEDMRPEVQKRMKADPRISPLWAKRQLRDEMWDKRQAELDERERVLREAEERARSGVVRTTATPGGPPSQSPTGFDAAISSGEVDDKTYAKACEVAEAGGAGWEKAKELLRRYDQGKVKIRTG